MPGTGPLSRCRTSSPSPRSRGLRRVVVVALACAASAAGASPASAAVQAGAPLDLPANVNEGCESVVFPQLRPVIGVPPTCTFYGGSDGARGWSSQTPRGRWVITAARVRAGARVGPMAFTLVQAMRSQAGEQPSGAICCTSAIESQVFVPAPNAVTTVPVRMPTVNVVTNIDGEPVEVVDYLGISLLSLESDVPAHLAAPGALGSGGQLSFIAPAIRPGAQRLSDGTFPQSTLLVNAVYEPDVDNDGLGDETQDSCVGQAGRRAADKPIAMASQCGVPAPVGPGATPLSIGDLRRNARRGTGRLQVTVPGAGVVVVRGRGVRRSRVRPGAAGATAVPVRVKGKARRRLARQGRVRVRLRVTFKAAGGGDPIRQTRRVTLRLRR